MASGGVGLEKRGNISRAALVSLVLCNILLLCDVLGSLQVQHIGFLLHWDPSAVISLEAVALLHIVTRWSGSGGIEAYLCGQLASYSAF